MEQDNRESWLNRAAVGMAPLLEALDIRSAWFASGWRRRARALCPMEGHGPMQHDPLDGDDAGDDD